MTTDITELVQRARINAECGEHLSPAETMELVEALESEKRICATWRKTAEANSEKLEKAQQRIAELENNEIQEEGNQFLVVRHPGKVPVIKHPVGELEDYLRQIFKADPLATIDIVTHRYYGVGGQFVEDADEYLHEMSIKVEAEMKIRIVLQELKEDGVLTTYSNGHVEMLPYRIDENGEEYVEMFPNDIEQH